ncbi:MAG: diadenylate cyclase CdaA [Tenericutes bacterium]|nr:diadenylate cyclase CdaA [Mycoplasmatota bacterium]MDY3802046.1 diadenylate cyclase CdaA [Bacilli bacterium]
MTLDSVFELIKKFADVLIVWAMFYYILKNLRKNVKMALLFKGIIIIIVLKLVSDLFDLVTISFILNYVIEWGPIALIIIFQPEIRNVLEQLGRSQLLGRHKVLTVDEREKVVYEIVNAVEYLKKMRIGALIVIERDNSLQDYIERSRKIYGDISSDLLISIFFPNNPLHDGGLIIQGDKITSAGAVFPTSDSLKISKRLGTRHRAALGISEETDCLSLVVSEETGRISIAMGGELFYNLTIDEFKLMILEELKPKKELVLDDEEDDLENENNNKEN